MIYAILGPTASGKSELASKLSKEHNDAPIINFDAFQVYKELNKGTAKPSIAELNSGNYYLYNYVSITEKFDVSRYQNDVRKLLSSFKNTDVIMVGGTGLYLKAALYDYKFYEEDPMPHDYLSNLSNDELYTRLLTIDKEDALKIGINNRKRLIRALYIYDVHKKSKTDLNQSGKSNLLYPNTKFIGIDVKRDILYKRIDERVDSMFRNGLIDEATYLFKHFDNSLKALQAIGYKEFLTSNDYDEVKKMIKNNTHHYAKRQMTFFLHQFNNVEWIKKDYE